METPPPIPNQQFNPGGSSITAPPPPPEVKVRTMRSDLESMAKSGGGLPSFANVRVSGLPSESESYGQAPTKNRIMGVVIISAIAIIVVGVAYLAYTIFLSH